MVLSDLKILVNLMAYHTVDLIGISLIIGDIEHCFPVYILWAAGGRGSELSFRHNELEVLIGPLGNVQRVFGTGHP